MMSDWAGKVSSDRTARYEPQNHEDFLYSANSALF